MIGIELQNVSFSYPNQPILESCNASFNSGQKISLFGENGAGKTTFLKLVSTLFKPIQGNIIFRTNEKNLDIPTIRRKIGVHLDDTHLLKYFTIAENLALYQKLYGVKESKESIPLWLDRFHLSKKKDTPIQYLSVGEQKKISIIKAFLHDPEILIFDEPTNSLDEDSRSILSNVFAALSRDKLLIVATHDKTWTKEWRSHEIKIDKGLLS